MVRLAHAFAVALLCLLAACGRLESPQQSGELVVAIRTGPASYQSEDGTASGFEYDMVEAFADSLNVKARYVIAGDQDELLSLVRDGQVHFAASAWIDGDAHLIYTQPLRESQQVVVGHGGEIGGTEDGGAALAGLSIEAMLASPQLAALTRLAGDPPRFTVNPRGGVNEFELLQEVADRQNDFAATDRLQYNLALHFLPDLEVAHRLPGIVRYGWAFANHQRALHRQAEDFIKASKGKNGLLARLTDRYFGYIERVKPAGVAEFFKKVNVVLPRYRRLFEAAQISSGIDWRLLAVLGYQESKWEPLSTSPTGVRGIMMLTEDTADHLKITDRLDPQQSISAGARYLADLRDQLPEEVAEPDRTWLALAAYNLGMGHLNAARTIAIQLKRDPNSWYEMKQVLPLLSRPQYYQRLKSGMGRGGEAVIMVENIRTFYDILCHFEPAWQPPVKFRK